MPKVQIKTRTRLIVFCPALGKERLYIDCEACPFHKSRNGGTMEVECNHPKAK